MPDYHCENCEFFEDRSTDKHIDGYCKKYSQSLNFYDWWEKCKDCIIETLQIENKIMERALRNAAPRLKCRGGLGEGFCGVDECDYYHCNNDEGCVKAHLRQAERELAEEKNE